MSFEEELTGAFDTLSARIRAEIEQEVQRRTAEIVAAVPAPATIAEPAPAEPVATPAADGASAARLNDALASIDAARTLTGILDALLAAALAEEPGAHVWLQRGGARHRWRAPGSDGAGHDAPVGSLARPITIAGADVAFLYAEPGTENSEVSTQNLNILARYAARSLEALTAFKAARALTQRPEPQAAPDAPADAEEDASARRYARLLVSEIKLYHEAAVIDGCRDRDLSTRLGGEIARARVMYEQRVPAPARGRADYFHDELVRTLCDGDASLLEVKSEKLKVES